MLRDSDSEDEEEDGDRDKEVDETWNLDDDGKLNLPVARRAMSLLDSCRCASEPLLTDSFLPRSIHAVSHHLPCHCCKAF
jgi:hypothetical protein